MDEGKESEWNEASFKSKRLHECQERINFFKLNPLGKTDGYWNYELLEKEIENLLGEGRSKYSKKEKEEIDKLKEVAQKSLKFMPPHTPIFLNSFDGTKKSYQFNKGNYEKFMDFLYCFEMKVKDLNDEHGLTTFNKDDTTGL